MTRLTTMVVVFKEQLMIKLGFVTKSGGVVIGYENEQDKSLENKRRVYVKCQNCSNVDLMVIKTVKHKKAYCTKCFIAGKRIDRFIGQKIGRWLVEEYVGRSNEYNYLIYRCICECGHIKELPSNCLDGRSKSCGCLKNELAKARYSHYPKKARKTRKISSSRWKKLTEIIKDRDHNCIICKSKSKLTAHHLNGWNWAVEERFSKDNLVLLCNICHDNFHKKYRKGNNTKEQFLEYIDNYDFKVGDIWL